MLNMTSPVKALWLPSAIPFFLFGFVYYLVSPYFVILLFDEGKAAEIAKNYINLSFFDARYWFDIVLVFLSWLTGYLFFSREQENRGRISFLDKGASYKIVPALIFFLLMSGFIYALYFAMSRGAAFFAGYSGAYDPLVLGQFSTLVFVSAWFFNFFNGPKKLIFLFVFFVTSFVLLGLGARMYFLMGMITITLGFLYTRRWLLFNPIFLIMASLMAVFIVFIGFWRLGLDVSLDNYLYTFFAEPLFTLTSAAQYIENAGRPLLGMPVDIFMGFLNFVPTILWPGKLEFISSFSESNVKFSPFGASSLYVNMYFNFGCFYWVYTLLTGCLFGMLKRRAAFSCFYRAVYLSTLPLLMFLYYRDGFISMVKLAVFNSFIFPMIMLFVLVALLAKKSDGEGSAL